VLLNLESLDATLLTSPQKAVALVKSRRAASQGINEAPELYHRVFAWNTIAKSLIEVAQQLTERRRDLQ
jgi:hypothetical protein